MTAACGLSVAPHSVTHQKSGSAKEERAHRASINKYTPTFVTVGSLESRRVRADGSHVAAGMWLSRIASGEASALAGKSRTGSLVFTDVGRKREPRRKLTPWEAMTGG